MAVRSRPRHLRGHLRVRVRHGAIGCQDEVWIDAVLHASLPLAAAFLVSRVELAASVVSRKRADVVRRCLAWGGDCRSARDLFPPCSIVEHPFGSGWVMPLFAGIRWSRDRYRWGSPSLLVLELRTCQLSLLNSNGVRTLDFGDRACSSSGIGESGSARIPADSICSAALCRDVCRERHGFFALADGSVGLAGQRRAASVSMHADSAWGRLMLLIAGVSVAFGFLKLIFSQPHGPNVLDVAMAFLPTALAGLLLPGIALTNTDSRWRSAMGIGAIGLVFAGMVSLQPPTHDISGVAGRCVQLLFRGRHDASDPCDGGSGTSTWMAMAKGARTGKRSCPAGDCVMSERWGSCWRWRLALCWPLAF